VALRRPTAPRPCRHAADGQYDHAGQVGRRDGLPVLLAWRRAAAAPSAGRCPPRDLPGPGPASSRRMRKGGGGAPSRTARGELRRQRRQVAQLAALLDVLAPAPREHSEMGERLGAERGVGLRCAARQPNQTPSASALPATGRPVAPRCSLHFNSSYERLGPTSSTSRFGARPPRKLRSRRSTQPAEPPRPAGHEKLELVVEPARKALAARPASAPRGRAGEGRACRRPRGPTPAT
jgi:hypothetical protein